GQKTRFAPVLPRFERIVSGRGRKTHAKSLVQVQADDADARSARKIRAVLPERTVGRLVESADPQLLYVTRLQMDRWRVRRCTSGCFSSRNTERASLAPVRGHSPIACIRRTARPEKRNTAY